MSILYVINMKDKQFIYYDMSVLANIKRILKDLKSVDF